MWLDAVSWLPSLDANYQVAVNSKSKFDRFDLSAYMAIRVLEDEAWFVQEVQRRIAATHQFTSYDKQAEGIAVHLLGSSGDARIGTRAFVRLERKTFAARRFSYPTPTARVTSTVTYTSPQGRNSYRKDLTWDFDQLSRSFELARAERARLSTAEARRKRERSLMTNSLRMDVLRRDGYRCQMCGATRKDGVQLHVDHIVPVSRDGRTVMENLQILCEDCNFGKGNRFSG